MSFRIQSPPQAVARELDVGKPGDATSKEDAAKVGRDFEAIFVRQMLSSTKVAGKEGGYADMAVEALAASITAAGGLGMGRAIEQALSSHTGAHHRLVTPESPAGGDVKNLSEAPQVSSDPAVREVGP